MSAQGTKEFIEMEQEQPAAATAKPPRLHHLDWLRAMMIYVAVFLHTWTTFVPSRPAATIDNLMVPVFDQSLAPHEYALFNQGEADWRETDYAWRYIMIGRQYAIPILFWISGCSMGIGKGGNICDSIRKVGLITAVGMAVNFGIWAAGPGDDSCSYQKSIDPNTPDDECNGVLFDWVVAPGGGELFAVLFQFWFTLFLMIFLGEVLPLWNALREIRDNAGETWSLPDASALKGAGLHWVIVTAVYVGFSFWLDEPAGSDVTRLPQAIYLSLMEIPFIFCLMLSCGMPASRPGAVRIAQYAAAVVGLFQFVLVQIPKLDKGGPEPPLDGRFVIYFHMFRQMLSLGFVMMLTRAKTAPVVSCAYPLMVLGLTVVAPFTNYYRGGVDTYPFFPFLFDRLLYTGGSYIHLFVQDRLGTVFANMGSVMPLPSAFGFGALLAYMFHPVTIVLLVSVWGTMHPLLSAFIMMLIFALIAEIINRLTSRGK